MVGRAGLLAGLLAAALLAGGHAWSDPREVHIATLEWPPYTGENLPEGVQPPRSRGRPSNVPVTRRRCPSCPGVAPLQWPPATIGTGPLGFAENAEAPLEWETLDDIVEQGLAIGTVRGYANTDEFDNLVDDEVLHAIAASDDITNLRKLLRERIDAAVIDQNVMAYRRQLPRMNWPLIRFILV